MFGGGVECRADRQDKADENQRDACPHFRSSCVILRQHYLHNGQGPDAANLVAALAAVPAAVMASATSAITFGFRVLGFILRILGSRRNHSDAQPEYGLQSG